MKTLAMMAFALTCTLSCSRSTVYDDRHDGSIDAAQSASLHSETQSMSRRALLARPIEVRCDLTCRNLRRLSIVLSPMCARACEQRIGMDGGPTDDMLLCAEQATTSEEARRCGW